MKTLTNLNKPPPNNLQAALQNLTEHIHQSAKHLTKEKMGRINTEIKNLKRNKDKIIEKANSLNSTNLENALERANQISSKILDIQSSLFARNQNTTKANWHLHREMINKYWCVHGKENKGHDTILELHLPIPTPIHLKLPENGR